jgi:hypothetical protein
MAAAALTFDHLDSRISENQIQLPMKRHRGCHVGKYRRQFHDKQVLPAG